MQILLYSKKQSNFLKENNYVIIYRRKKLIIEERFFRPKTCYVASIRIDQIDKPKVYLGYYFISFYKYAEDNSMIHNDFKEHLNKSGYDDFRDWIRDSIIVNGGKYPSYGAFYLIQKDTNMVIK